MVSGRTLGNSFFLSKDIPFAAIGYLDASIKIAFGMRLLFSKNDGY